MKGTHYMHSQEALFDWTKSAHNEYNNREYIGGEQYNQIQWISIFAPTPVMIRSVSNTYVSILGVAYQKKLVFWFFILGCADCFLDDHITHQRKSTLQFKEQVNQQIDQIAQVEFQPITDSPQKDLEKQIDLELENCIECIKQRFTSIKQDLKGQIDQDMTKLQDNCMQFQQNMNNELDPFKNIMSNELPVITQNEINSVVKFYQEAPKIHKHYSKTADYLQDERQKIKQKKQKYLGKMRTIMQILLREFNELMTTKNVQYDDGSEYETPQKQAMSPNKMINLVETARSSRRFPMSQSKKYFLASVAKKLD